MVWRSAENIRGISAGIGLAAILSQGFMYGYLKIVSMDNWITYHAMTIDGDQIAGKGFSVSSKTGKN